MLIYAKNSRGPSDGVFRDGCAVRAHPLVGRIVICTIIRTSVAELSGREISADLEIEWNFFRDDNQGILL